MNFNIEKILTNENNTNIILYGKEITCIYETLIKILTKLNNNKKISKITKDKLVFDVSDTYIYVNMNKIILKNIEVFFNILLENIQTKNSFCKRQRKYIILNNYETVKISIQNRLRVIIEKYYDSSCFIIISKRYDQIIWPIKSRSLCIRVPLLTINEKREIVQGSVKVEYNNEKSKFYDIIYELTNKEDIQFLCKYYHLIDKKSYYDRIFMKIINVINNNLTERIYNDIKVLAYYIELYCIDIFNYDLIKKFFRKEFTLAIKLEILSIFTESNYIYRNVYRKIIVIESLLFKLNYLMNTGNYKIYRDD